MCGYSKRPQATRTKISFRNLRHHSDSQSLTQNNKYGSIHFNHPRFPTDFLFKWISSIFFKECKPLPNTNRPTSALNPRPWRCSNLLRFQPRHPAEKEQTKSPEKWKKNTNIPVHLAKKLLFGMRTKKGVLEVLQVEKHQEMEEKKPLSVGGVGFFSASLPLRCSVFLFSFPLLGHVHELSQVPLTLLAEKMKETRWNETM